MTEKELNEKLSNLSAGQKTHVLNALEVNPALPKSENEWQRIRGIGPKTREKLRASGLLVDNKQPATDNISVRLEWVLSNNRIPIQKELVRKMFEGGFNFSRFRLVGKKTLSELAIWCGYPLKPTTKLIYILLVSGEPCGWTHDKQWAEEWAQQLEGRSTVEVGEIKRHKP